MTKPNMGTLVQSASGSESIMQLLSTLKKMIGGEQGQLLNSVIDERSATRPMQSPIDRDATRPTYRITDQKWQKIQKAIDQAG